MQVGHPVRQQHQRHGGQKAPEHDPAGDDEVVVLLGIFLDQNGVHSPHKGGGQRQQVTLGTEMERHLSVKHHQYHAGEGDDGADIHKLAQTLAAAGEKLGQNHRQDRRQRHEDADVGGIGVGEGGILQEEVERTAGDANEDEHQLVLPGELQRLGAQHPQRHIGKRHAQGDDLDGGIGLQQLLGQHKAAAPDQNGKHGVDVAHRLFRCRHMRSLLTTGFPAHSGPEENHKHIL